ncbi:cytochrome P450 [Paenibacillus sp. GYB003]|uniref:cytochrome P450 n=1 Tax=Paenibacillus sp. GYB003 TaxID=2994392 RepID=UPI002F96CAEC
MSKPINLQLDPYPWYEEMLKAPVAFHPQYGAYLIFRFDEVRRVFGDPDTFSSAVYEGLSEELAFGDQIQGMDPPRHTQLRALATHAFTRRSVAELEPRIQQMAHDLLDPIMDREEFDFVRSFAIPLPIAVIADMLGVPKEDNDTFKEWSDLITVMSERLLTGMPDDPDHVAAMRDMRAYFQRLLEERRLNPREDLVSKLAAAEVDGRRLTPLEASNFCLLLLVAGNETTTNLLVNAVRTFTEHPEQWELLRSNPDLIPRAVEEVMRYRTSVQLMYRTVKKEVELGGAQMKPGDRVVLFMGAANRDPEKYDRPHVFDITRTPSPHLTFGHGIHQCLGAPLARMEVAAALQAMSTRISKLHIPDEAELVPLSNFNMLGLQKLPLKLAR